MVCVRENKLGLSHARNRGIEAARGELIAFIDDDAWPEVNWLTELEKSFSEPCVACVGGRVAPAFAGKVSWPSWLPERLQGFFTVVEYPGSRYLHYPDYPAGTNIAFRRSALRETGIFNPHLGRTGESLLSMEEADLCLRLERAGHRIAYNPEAVVHHAVAEGRLSREWVRERARCQGISAAIIEKEFFPAREVAVKSLKYRLFIAAGRLGELFGRLTGNERLEFFCGCQTVLCRAYLEKVRELP
jgi:cellulose synthase/poly-beta-1,6-N-acetylglucosamine synthase-like glycosyltransferase